MKVFVKKSAYEKLKKRFVWVYENEIEKAPKCDAGSIVDIYYKNEFLGVGFYNPLSKISIRILSFEDVTINKDFFKNALLKAFIKRNKNYKRKKIKLNTSTTNSYRLVHSEADFLPGLIVDKYEENLVVSFTTAGMDNYKGIIIELLIELLNPKGIYEKGDNVRKKEGLEVVSQQLYGHVDEEFIIEENSRKFLTNIKEGQKTGFFLDQRYNRKRVSQFKSKKVLDLFSNAGGFGIYTKADYIKFVEISALACTLIEKNCQLNGIKNFEIVKTDVFDFLKDEKKTYDLIIIDPPAFAKTKSAKKGAMKGWKYLITNSLKLLEDNGYLALFSCSHSLNSKDLLDLALSSSIINNCYLEVIEFLKQDIDHPYLVNIPNSLYLTGVLLKKVKS